VELTNSINGKREGEQKLERNHHRSSTEQRNRNANRCGNQEMKPAHLQNQGFTMIEIMLAVAIGSLMLAATMAASICLQRSFNAVDNYFSSHVQQVRIIDYLSRDVRRSYIVTTSTDLQTVTCIIPNYLVDNGSNQPTRATQTLSLVVNKVVANHQASTVNNVTTTQGSTTVFCPGLGLVSSH